MQPVQCPDPEELGGALDRQPPTVCTGPARPPAYPFLRPARQAGEIGRLGNYRVLGLMGSGGTGLIFRAEDLDLERPVALKVLKPHLCKDAEGWRRFQREARIMASIKHEHLVTVYQVGQEESTAFLAMELLEGDALDVWLKRVGVPTLTQVLRVAKEIVSGLVVIHRHGIVHRDIKPANIWLSSPGGKVKILDFGLASFFKDDANLTRPGTIMGTPTFMSPEQARGEKVDIRSDLFSLGAVLYCLGTGKKPFRDDNTMAVLTSLAMEDPDPAHELNPAIPRPLSDLIGELLAKNPAQRPSSAGEVLKRLEQIESGKDHDLSARSLSITKLTPAPGVRGQNTSQGPSKAKIGAAMLLIFMGVFGATQLGTGLVGLASPSKDATEGGSSEGGQWSFPPGFFVKFPGGKGFPAGPEGFGETFGCVRVQVKMAQEGPFAKSPQQPVPGNPTILNYRLNKHYSTFKADVGIKTEREPTEGPLRFCVYGDDKLLWKSQPLTVAGGTQSCHGLPVKGVDVLRLEIPLSGPVRGDHMVWIDPSVGP